MNSSNSRPSPATAATKNRTSTTAANLPTVPVEASGIAGGLIAEREERTGTGGAATRGRAGGGGGSGEDMVGLFGIEGLGGGVPAGAESGFGANFTAGVGFSEEFSRGIALK